LVPSALVSLEVSLSGSVRAAPPAEAQTLYNYFVEAARRSRVPVETGVFQAEMQVHLVNEGPVTIWIDTEERGRK
jgi:D-tyrosyl-tRNA(Tyr) deacylase